ncbi:MAG: Ig-like domain-containing protein, partial [Blastocatellia bacterium]
MLTRHALILNLLIWPAPGVSLRPVFDSAATLACTFRYAFETSGRQLQRWPVVLVPLGPLAGLVPALIFWPFQTSAGALRQEGLAERIARVAAVRISPNKLVGYVGDSVTFVAMGTDIANLPVQGAKFTWTSSNSDKLTIDEAGRARLLQHGLVLVAARAGLAQQTAAVLIRPSRRRLQTDSEWRIDQDSLIGDSGQSADDGRPGLLGSVMERIAPVAHAQ